MAGTYHIQPQEWETRDGKQNDDEHEQDEFQIIANSKLFNETFKNLKLEL